VTAEHVQNMFVHNHARERQPPEFQFRQLGLSAEDGVVAFHGANNPRVQSKTAVSLSLVKANYRRDKELLSPVLRLAHLHVHATPCQPGRAQNGRGGRRVRRLPLALIRCASPAHRPGAD